VVYFLGSKNVTVQVSIHFLPSSHQEKKGAKGFLFSFRLIGHFSLARQQKAMTRNRGSIKLRNINNLMACVLLSG
jgi:hypothetical protein